MSFLKAALKVAGTPFHVAASGFKGLGRLAQRIPVVGTPIHTIFDVASGPFDVTDALMRGGRFDRVLYNNLKKNIRGVKTLAPYVQTVVSFVPGLGTTAAGIIAASVALSKGQPITDVVMAGVKGSIPGGPAAQAAFEFGVAAVQGHNLGEAALESIPLPAQQRQYIAAAAHAMNDLAHGRPVDETIIKRGLNVAPDTIRKALTIGVAMGHAKTLQDAVKRGAQGAAPVLAQEGLSYIKSSPVFSAGLKSIPAKLHHGFAVGIGALSHSQTPLALKSIRDSLNGKGKTGFDIAVAARIGANKGVPDGTPSEQFGAAVAKGAKKATPQMREHIGKALFSSLQHIEREGMAAALSARKVSRRMFTRPAKRKQADAIRAAAMQTARDTKAFQSDEAKTFAAYHRTANLHFWARVLIALHLKKQPVLA